MKTKPKQLPINRLPSLQIITRPNDANPGGDIFGGWLMSHADIAGAIEASRFSEGHVATRSVKNFEFLQPLYVSDIVSFYTEMKAVGTTSMTVFIEVYAERLLEDSKNYLKIAEATIVYVAISKPGQKRILNKKIS